jgi:hypothetical protein
MNSLEHYFRAAKGLRKAVGYITNKTLSEAAKEFDEASEAMVENPVYFQTHTANNEHMVAISFDDLEYIIEWLDADPDLTLIDHGDTWHAFDRLRDVIRSYRRQFKSN